MTPSLSGYLLTAGIVAALGACAVSYTAGRASRTAEISALTAVAEAESARNRQLTQEVADAQQGYVKAWRMARDADKSDWLRLKATSRDRVPVVCAESGGAEADRGHGVEAVSAEGDRDLLPVLVAALERGEEVEATLRLCQSELRQCAGLR